jgi:hypothetical protein
MRLPLGKIVVGVLASGVAALVPFAFINLVSINSLERSLESDPPDRWPVSNCRTAALVPVNGSRVQGTALLCTDGDVVRPSVYAANLTAGAGYRGWIALPRRGDGCSDDGCTNGNQAQRAGVSSPRLFGQSVASLNGSIHIRGHFERHAAAVTDDVAVIVVLSCTALDSSADGFLAGRRSEWSMPSDASLAGSGNRRFDRSILAVAVIRRQERGSDGAPIVARA